MINKENYEAYFLDYIEGNLSQKDIDMLLLFLSNHPELKNQLEEFQDIQLSPIAGEFDKSTLLKVDLTNDLITNQNFEAFAIADLEQELSEEKSKELINLGNSNPSISNDIQLVAKSVLVADQKVVYPNKGELKKSVPFIFYYYRMAGIAAILLIGLYLFIPESSQKASNLVASNKEVLNVSNNENDNVQSNLNDVENQIAPNTTTVGETNEKLESIENVNLVSKQDDKSASFDNTQDRNIEINSSPLEIETVDPMQKVLSKGTYIASVVSSRKVSGSIPVSIAVDYYESENGAPSQSTKENWLSPKEFLTSLFKKEILRSDDEVPTLNPEDFNNTLASVTNNKIAIHKTENQSRYISINTKNFSYEKKISQ